MTPQILCTIFYSENFFTSTCCYNNLAVVEIDVVSDSHEGNAGTAGDHYTLQCYIHRKDITQSNTLLEVMWLDNNSDVISSGTAYTVSGLSNTTSPNFTSTLTFPRLKTSQGGQYMCVVNVTIPDVVKDLQVSSSYTVRVASESSRLIFFVHCIDLVFPPIRSSGSFQCVHHLPTR